MDRRNGSPSLLRHPPLKENIAGETFYCIRYTSGLVGDMAGGSVSPLHGISPSPVNSRHLYRKNIMEDSGKNPVILRIADNYREMVKRTEELRTSMHKVITESDSESRAICAAAIDEGVKEALTESVALMVKKYFLQKFTDDFNNRYRN